MYEEETYRTDDVWATNFVHHFCISYISADLSQAAEIKLLNLSLAIEGQVKHIVISKGTELLRVPADRLMYISSDGNYSNVVTLDGQTRFVSLQLGQIEDLIGNQLVDNGGNFLRLGRSLIINVDYIYLVDVAKQQLILSDCAGSKHDLTASREVLIKLKAYIEALMTTENDKKD